MTEVKRAERLEELYARIRGDSGYRNARMADTFVPGCGSLADGMIVLIGEAPGRNEELTGRPFVGAAGKNLDCLLDVAGLSRNSLFITNVIKYRPVSPDGKNRNPTAAECRKALPYLVEELEILSPGLAVCLGLCPTRTLIGEGLAMQEANGTIFRRFGTDMLVTYHPSPFNYMIAKKREEMRRAFTVLRDFLAA